MIGRMVEVSQSGREMTANFGSPLQGQGTTGTVSNDPIAARIDEHQLRLSPR